MFRKFSIIVCCLLLTSCTASRQQTRSVSRPIGADTEKVIVQTQIPPSQENDEIDERVDIGLIFAKTIFEGVVKTSYVELIIVDQDSPDQKFQLIIGDKERQKSFPWKVQTVKPGYFFIELPQGHYRIQSMAIPVGTTKAQEEVDIVFDVNAQKATYLGTLKILGTKEKVKLGGVPVLQPGFEYNVNVVNEESEAYEEFQFHFPEYPDPVITNLMQVNMASNVGSNPS